MKKIGLIGGMSWQSTAIYYEEINKHIRSRLGGLHSANLLLRSLDYADVARFVSTDDWEGATTLFADAGRGLKAAGADGIVFCANVAHKAADSVQADVGLPVLHIADFTAEQILERGFKRVGLLATRQVMEEGFYKDRLRDKFGLEVFVPDGEFRSRINAIVFNELGKDVVTEETRKLFDRGCERLFKEDNVECIMLACTEFRLVLKDGDTAVPLFETTTLHARGVAEWALEDSYGLIRAPNEHSFRYLTTSFTHDMVGYIKRRGELWRGPFFSQGLASFGKRGWQPAKNPFIPLDVSSSLVIAAEHRLKLLQNEILRQVINTAEWKAYEVRDLAAADEHGMETAKWMAGERYYRHPDGEHFRNLHRYGSVAQ